MSDKKDKKPLKKKGEFSEKRKVRQRQASIYNTLNDACKKVMARDSDGFLINPDPVTVTVDNREFTLTNTSINDDYPFFAFLRLKKRGIVLAQCCTRDSGWIDIILPYSAYIPNARAIINKSVSADVSKIKILEDNKPNSQSSKRLKLFISD